MGALRSWILQHSNTHKHIQGIVLYLNLVVSLDFRQDGVEVTTDVIRQEAERKEMSNEMKNLILFFQEFQGVEALISQGHRRQLQES